jgi:uncharacterized membrane protein
MIKAANRGLMEGVGNGEAPYFAFTVERENGKLACAAFKIANRLGGGDIATGGSPQQLDVGDQAIMGMADSRLRVVQGQSAVTLDLSQVTGARPKGIALCANCGASVEGAFCPKCGVAANVASGPAIAIPAATAGLTENIAGALCYLGGLLTGIIFLVLAPYNQNPRIKFHAFQSIFFNLVWIVGWFASIPLGMLLPYGFSALLSMVSLLLSLGGILVWLLLMWKAYQGQPLSLPVIGGIAQQQAGK